MSINSKVVGSAGEHYVMSQLLRRGLVAALAPEGVPNADIIVTDIECKNLCSIQVKTRRAIGSDHGWHMKQKHEDIVSNNLFYCFVDLGKSLTDVISTYVVPSKVVAEALKRSHAAWLSNPGAKGQQRTDGDLRRFRIDYTTTFGNAKYANLYKKGWLDPYFEKWDLITDKT